MGEAGEGRQMAYSLGGVCLSSSDLVLITFMMGTATGLLFYRAVRDVVEWRGGRARRSGKPHKVFLPANRG